MIICMIKFSREVEIIKKKPLLGLIQWKILSPRKRIRFLQKSIWYIQKTVENEYEFVVGLIVFCMYLLVSFLAYMENLLRR